MTAAFGARLGKLRPSVPTPPVVSNTDDLTARIKRMAAGPRRRREPVTDQELARRVQGRVVAKGLIEIDRQLDWPDEQELGCWLPQLPDGINLHAPDWVVIDTETSGLAGGAGTIAFLLGAARVEQGRLHLRQWLLSGFSGEAEMLRSSAEWIGESCGLISFNGKSFDVPLLVGRARLARQPDEFSARPHLDLLHPVRRAFSGSWPDCRQATAELRLLGRGRIGDLPGSEAPAAWREHLEQGDPRRLVEVVKHNERDLHGLARLLPPLARLYRTAAHPESNPGAMARAWERQGSPALARTLLTRHVGRLDQRSQLDLARLHRRAGEWRRASLLWRKLASQGSAEALEELAKFHEHVERDVPAAIDCARRLPKDAASQRRMVRLNGKLDSNLGLPL